MDCADVSFLGTASVRVVAPLGPATTSGPLSRPRTLTLSAAKSPANAESRLHARLPRHAGPGSLAEAGRGDFRLRLMDVGEARGLQAQLGADLLRRRWSLLRSAA